MNAIIGFDWDDGNDRKNAEKHSVSKCEAEEVFFNQPLLLLEDKKHSVMEPRFHALGKTGTTRLLHITFTLRENQSLLRIISARDMHKKERIHYEQAR